MRLSFEPVWQGSGRENISHPILSHMPDSYGSPETSRLIGTRWIDLQPRTKRHVPWDGSSELSKHDCGHPGLSSQREIGYAQFGWGQGVCVVYFGRSGGDIRGYGLGFVPWGIFGHETVRRCSFGRVSLWSIVFNLVTFRAVP
jgi:hypothetical protein